MTIPIIVMVSIVILFPSPKAQLKVFGPYFKVTYDFQPITVTPVVVTPTAIGAAGEEAFKRA
jgi:hypothetical protein